MMDLRVSVVLLFIFITGGYSLRCYTCMPDTKGSCDGEEQTCPDGFSKCASMRTEVSIGSNKKSFTFKRCAAQCEPGSYQIDEGTFSLRCCGTDLCNAADGVSKGSLLLLFSPLLFYFLFQ